MEIHQVAHVLSILLLVSSALSLPLPYAQSKQQLDSQSTGLGLTSSLDVVEEATGDSLLANNRTKRGYLPAAIAYSPVLSLAPVAGVPIVAAPVVSSVAYYGHFGKPAIVPPLPHAYSALTYTV